ncbi:MAG: hypothetical protein DI535_13955 [Citrobacter freundii]|nr:MAG: hypothetical protein DI535_13955 [Citrobacter freundii]
MFQLLLVLLFFVGITAVDRLIVAAIASSGLSFERKIFCKAFLPITLFLSVLLFINPRPEIGWIVFVLLLLGARVIALLADGNRYIRKISLYEDFVEVFYITDFLQRRSFHIRLSEIRSLKVDNVTKPIDLPCMVQLVPRKGRVIKLCLIDWEQLMLHEKDIFALIQRLEFTERR